MTQKKYNNSVFLRYLDQESTPSIHPGFLKGWNFGVYFNDNWLFAFAMLINKRDGTLKTDMQRLTENKGLEKKMSSDCLM